MVIFPHFICEIPWLKIWVQQLERVVSKSMCVIKVFVSSEKHGILLGIMSLSASDTSPTVLRGRHVL